MREWIYLLFNFAIFIPPLILSLTTDVKTHKNWKALGLGYLFVSVPFILWDIWAAANGHWLFSSTYILSPRLFGLPFEEYLFFFTVPFAMMFVWDVLSSKIPNRDTSETLAFTAMCLLFLASFMLLVAQWGRGYTRSVAIAGLIVFAVVLWSRWWRRNLFWWFQLVLFSLFFITNTFLTLLPVITYGDMSFMGIRIGSIPIEDFLFNFALINLFLVVYTRYLDSNPKRTTRL